jgi:beta-lactamase class A
VRYILLLSLLISCTHLSKKNTEFDLASGRVCEFINSPKEESYKLHFSKEFLTAVPYDKIVPLIEHINQTYGKCQKVDRKDANNLQGTFVLKNEKALLDFSMVVDEQSIIKGLLFKGEFKALIEFKDDQDVMNEFKKLQGEKVIHIGTTNLKKTSFSLNDDKKQPLASVFKLYVLMALAEKIQNEKLSWEHKIPIKTEYKSLPSGVMQNEKNGAMFSLFDYAQKMISISDNTATDHLIGFIGKSAIEKMISKKGISQYAKEMTPFLTTKELFAIRADFSDADTEKYLSSNRSERLKMLKKTSAAPNDKILKKLESWTEPKHNMQIEWFASAKDICKTYDVLFDEFDSKEMRAILGLNTPFVTAEKSTQWNYVGYKGGSERGVLQMAYYFEDKRMDQWCLYIGQYDEKKSFNENDFFRFVQSLFAYLERRGLE